ncbi:hypothetical protein BC827DRAFT_1387321 [Russula dissimulans]|nr:hypothetical protein BC827DRAFT_1387321 [Russula dissimulans]
MVGNLLGQLFIPVSRYKSKLMAFGRRTGRHFEETTALYMKLNYSISTGQYEVECMGKLGSVKSEHPSSLSSPSSSVHKVRHISTHVGREGEAGKGWLEIDARMESGTVSVGYVRERESETPRWTRVISEKILRQRMIAKCEGASVERSWDRKSPWPLRDLRGSR